MPSRPLLILMPLVAFCAVGCAPRQDPGIPLPPPGSGAAALGIDGKTAGIAATENATMPCCDPEPATGRQ